MRFCRSSSNAPVSRPGGGSEEILEAGLDLLSERHAKRKGIVQKPHQRTGSADPAVLTAAVKRQVWKRDGGRCRWPIESGGICGSILRLEFDHCTPRALGGLSTADDVRLLCRMHNDLAARRLFGDGWMDRFTGNVARPDVRSVATTDGANVPVRLMPETVPPA